MQSVLNKYVCVSLFLTSTLFASQPPALGAAVQPAKKCSNEAHALVLAERKKLADEIGQSNTSLLAPLASIVASYCISPMIWQHKKELRVPNSAWVKSITEYGADKIVVNYVGTNLAKPDIATWNFSQTSKAPNDEQLSKLRDDWFVPTGQDNVIGVIGHCEGWTLNLLDLHHKKRKTVFSARVCHEGEAMHAIVAFPGACCAVSWSGKLGLIKELTPDGKIVVQLLGIMPKDEVTPKVVRSSLTAVDYRPIADTTACVEITSCTISSGNYSTKIRALCPLPNNRLAVGDDAGCLGIINCTTKQWEGTLIQYRGALPTVHANCLGSFGLAHSSPDFSITAIVSWPHEIIAVVAESRSTLKKHIACWDTKTQEYLGVLFGSERLINQVCALPDGRLAVKFIDRIAGAPINSRTDNVLDIYNVVRYQKEDNSYGVKAILEQKISVQQKISSESAADTFVLDQISPWGITPHQPFYLTKASLPTLALGTKSGAVHIYEQAACPDCEPEKQITVID